MLMFFRACIWILFFLWHTFVLCCCFSCLFHPFSSFFLLFRCIWPVCKEVAWKRRAIAKRIDQQVMSKTKIDGRDNFPIWQSCSCETSSAAEGKTALPTMNIPWRARVNATLIRFSTSSRTCHLSGYQKYILCGSAKSKASNGKEAHLTSPGRCQSCLCKRKEFQIFQLSGLLNQVAKRCPKAGSTMSQS